MKFDWSFLKLSKRAIYLVQNITVAILLQITELLTEPTFTCRCNSLRIWFVLIYFVIPAVAFSAFALSLEQGKIFVSKCCGENSGGANADANRGTGSNAGEAKTTEREGAYRCCCQSTSRFLPLLWKALFPGLCWIVILLIDGKYAACGLYSKCSNTTTTVNMTDSDMEYYMMVSKIIGLGLVLLFVVGYFIYLCCNCCQSSADRYEAMYKSLLEEDREKFAKNYAAKCSEKRAESCETILQRAVNGNTTPPRAQNTTPSGDRNTAPLGANDRTEHGAVGDPKINELDTKTIVDKIEKAFEFPIEMPPRAKNTTPSRVQETIPSGAESPAEHRRACPEEIEMESVAEDQPQPGTDSPLMGNQ